MQNSRILKNYLHSRLISAIFKGMKNVNNRQKKIVAPRPAFKRQSLRLLRQLAQKKEHLILPPIPVKNPGAAEDSDSNESKSE